MTVPFLLDMTIFNEQLLTDCFSRQCTRWMTSSNRESIRCVCSCCWTGGDNKKLVFDIREKIHGSVAALISSRTNKPVDISIWI